MVKIMSRVLILFTIELLNSNPISVRYSSSCLKENVSGRYSRPQISVTGMKEKENEANSMLLIKNRTLSWMYPPRRGSRRYIWNWFIILKKPVEDESPDRSVGALAAIANTTVP